MLGDVSRHSRPMRPSTWTRRAFLGGAAAAAVPAAVVAGVKLSESPSAAGTGASKPDRAA